MVFVSAKADWYSNTVSICSKVLNNFGNAQQRIGAYTYIIKFKLMS